MISFKGLIPTASVSKKSGFIEDEENYQDIFNQIMEHLDLNEENYKHDPKYIALLDGLNKKKEL